LSSSSLVSQRAFSIDVGPQSGRESDVQLLSRVTFNKSQTLVVELSFIWGFAFESAVNFMSGRLQTDFLSLLLEGEMLLGATVYTIMPV
jgi:hypothetical protein